MTVCTIDFYTPAVWPSIMALLNDWPFKPFLGHDQWTAEGLSKMGLARAAHILRSPQAVSWVAHTEGKTLGFVTLSRLPWDSEQLGYPTARLDYLVASGTYQEQYEAKQALLNAVLRYCTEQGLQYLFTRLDASDLSGLHVLEQSGFITVDGLLTFARSLTNWAVSASAPGLNLRLATAADAAGAAELARYAYVYDRFHADAVIPVERANALHAVWARNSCTGQAADAVVLAEDAEGLLGFVTCKVHQDTNEHLGQMIGTIVLVATAVRARGRGIGRAMTLAALDWFHRSGVSLAEVSTQFRNIPASRLYASCAFRLVGSSITLRQFIQGN